MGNGLKTGGHYIAIPFSNGLIEYDERDALTSSNAKTSTVADLLP